MKATATLDTSMFDRRMKDLDKKLENQIIRDVLVFVLFSIKIDAEKIPPMAPILTGDLRQQVVVEYVEKFKAFIQYLVPYAARWHEAVGENINWSQPGVGPKWIETRFIQGQKWGKIAADFMKQAIEAA